MSKANKYKPQALKIPVVQSIPNEQKKPYPIPREELELVKDRNKDKLLFSFKFFDRETDAFNLAATNRVCENWFINLFDILKEVSDLSRNQLMIVQRQFYDAHAHDFENLEYKYPLDEDFMEQIECVQFRLSKSRGRVHGFIVGNRFYVIWLDPHHNLYPDERHGGVKIFNKEFSCAEILENQILNLYEKVWELEEKNQNLQEEYNSFLNEHDNALRAIDDLTLEKQKLVDITTNKQKRQDKYTQKMKNRKKVK